MSLLELVNLKLSIETVLAQVFIVLAVVYFLFFRKKYNFVGEFFGKWGILFAFLISLASALSSLFYSEIAGFPPCDFCWYQRIFMYPLVILLGLALIKRDNSIVDYTLSLSVVGFLISLYHNFIYYYNNGLNANCQILGKGVSCVKRYVFEFGYITIPMMAITAFSLVIIFLIFSKLEKKL